MVKFWLTDCRAAGSATARLACTTSTRDWFIVHGVDDALVDREECSIDFFFRVKLAISGVDAILAISTFATLLLPFFECAASCLACFFVVLPSERLGNLVGVFIKIERTIRYIAKWPSSDVFGYIWVIARLPNLFHAICFGIGAHFVAKEGRYDILRERHKIMNKATKIRKAAHVGDE